MKVVSILSSVLLIFLIFPSCAGKSLELSNEEIANEIKSAVPLDEGYYQASEKYFAYYFKDDKGNSLKVSDWAIYRSNSQSSENEFGIITTRVNNVDSIKSACQNYIETRRKAYLEAKAAYSPEEYEKYRDAKVEVYGNTVVYFIMTKEDSELSIEKIEALNK